jgi:alpha-N-arabinofuranosidase
MSGNFVWRDEFDKPSLDRAWMYLRVPKSAWADLVAQPGRLAIHPLAEGLNALRNPSFLARRQQHLAFEASTSLSVPSRGVAAGLALFQNEHDWYFLGVRRRHDDIELFLQKSAGAQVASVATKTISPKATARNAPAPNATVKLKVVANGADYSFAFAVGDGGWQWLSRDDDGTILSTDVAGGFIGAVLGPYARIETAE